MEQDVHFLHETVQLRGRGLVEAHVLFHAEDADGFQQAEGAQAICVGGILWGIEADFDVTHGREVVNLMRLDLLHDADEVGGIREVPIVQLEPDVLFVWILIEVVDSIGVEQRSAPLDPVDLVAF